MKFLPLVLVVLCINPVLHAQLCKGSLGDPTVNITFGHGANPGPSLGNITNMSYVSFDCPNDGQYTIINSTMGCFGNTWFNFSHDHTGDAQGYFMLINASFTPSDFYVDTVSGLCAGTTYEFASWVLNMMNTPTCGGGPTILPNITFNIETTTGSVLGTYSTGNIPVSSTPTWVQYGTFFQTPANVNRVVLRMTNNAPGGCGNDLALDDITFRPCGPTVNAVNNINNESTGDLCTGDTTIVYLKATYSEGYTQPVLQWQNSTDKGNSWTDIAGANSTSYNDKPLPPSGVYMYRLGISEKVNETDLGCRVFSNPVTYTFNPVPTATATDASVCNGNNVTLNAYGGSTYLWSGPANFSSAQQSPVVTNAQPVNAGTYKVKVTSDKGCSDSTTMQLSVDPLPQITASSNTSICQGETVQLNASGANKYVWQPAALLSNDTIANPVASPDTTTTFKVIGYNNASCSDSAFVNVAVWQKAVANAGPDLSMLQDAPVYLQGAVSGTDITYYWSPSSYLDNINSLNPLADPPQTITYTLTANSQHGCGVSTDNMVVTVYKKITIPNAFSPNGDGINDTWNIQPLDLFSKAVLQVFNRYGQLVFESHGYSKQWDGTVNGKPLPVGTYYYILDLKLDSSITLVKSVMSGNVTILR
jgi:gliding motility-associated-like protein